MQQRIPAVLGAPASLIGSELSSLLGSDSSSCPYSPECVEGEFCEVRAATTVLLERGFATCVIILVHLDGHEGRSSV
jgi:hypothetical protein